MPVLIVTEETQRYVDLIKKHPPSGPEFETGGALILLFVGILPILGAIVAFMIGWKIISWVLRG